MSKVFVGSIPTDTPDEVVKAEFDKHGPVLGFYMRRDPSGPQRSWAFVTYNNRDDAMRAIDATGGGKLIFPGAQAACEVGFARSSQAQMTQGATAGQVATPTKLFVGSIPAGTTESTLRSAFEVYGTVVEVFLKNDGGRMWAFVAFADANAAALAVASTHDKLVFPGATRACDVQFAKSIGPGGGGVVADGSMLMAGLPPPALSVLPPPVEPTKLFVQNIPAGTTELGVSQEFSKYGNVSEIFLRSDAGDPSSMWAFVSFFDRSQADIVVMALNNQLVLPGGTRPISVSYSGSAGSGGLAAELGVPSPLAMVPAQSSYAVGAMPEYGGKSIVTTPSAFNAPAVQSGPTKLFVGSVPGGTSQQQLHDEFAKYGQVAEIFLRNDNTEAGRMWGFVTFVFPDGAAKACAAMNEQFVFPGATRPLAVSFARSSQPGGSGGSGGGGGGGMRSVPAAMPTAPGVMGGPTKLFIGSIPGGTTKEILRAEFEKFGPVMDIFLKDDKDEPLRMWGFITYQDAPAASNAVQQLHERLVLPGGSRPCAVSFARNSQAQHSQAAQAVVNPTSGLTKLFLGTIPIGTTEAMVRTEFERFGQVTEVFLKSDQSNEGRMWGFLSYADPQCAAIAVSSLHEKLMLPGSIRPMAVSFARSGVGPGGGAAATPDPSAIQYSAVPAATTPAVATVMSAAHLPVATPPPGSAWKVYFTAEGLAYYHNHGTGVTQWDIPAELAPFTQAPSAGGASLGLAPQAALTMAPAMQQTMAPVMQHTPDGHLRYAPY